MRAIVDVNVLLRALLALTEPTRAVSVILSAALSGTFDLLLPPDLVAELADEMENRSYFATRVSVDGRSEYLATLTEIGITTAPYRLPFAVLTRDVKDDYLLAYALRDDADFLVTGDLDLLVLSGVYPRPQILDPGAFVRELRQRGLIP